MIAYSPEAEPARAYLLRTYNDIDIYVEDATCQNMYVRLFNRMLAKTGKRITHVYPLHGRDNVINHCRAGVKTNLRRAFYVIDADQDLILGRSSPQLRNLYRLKLYCAENLLLSEHALVTIGTECQTSAAWHEMALTLSLRSLLDKSVKMLLPLFVAYAIAHKLELGIATVRIPVQRLLRDHNDPNSLSNGLIRSRTLSILKECRSRVSKRKYRSVRNSIVGRLKKNAYHHSDYLSGKTYLLPLAHLQLRRFAQLNDSQEGLKVRLAGYCELTIDSGLRRALLRAVAT